MCLYWVVMVVAADGDSPQQSIPKNQQNGHHQVNSMLFQSVTSARNTGTNDKRSEIKEREKKKIDI